MELINIHFTQMKTIMCTAHYIAPDVIQLNIVDELKVALGATEMNRVII